MLSHICSMLLSLLDKICEYLMIYNSILGYFASLFAYSRSIPWHSQFNEILCIKKLVN